MAFVSLGYLMWTEIFSDLTEIGKILFAPLFVVGSVALLIGAIACFVLFDICCISICALSKNITVADYFEYWFY